jgi:hypothetical protein
MAGLGCFISDSGAMDCTVVGSGNIQFISGFYILCIFLFGQISPKSFKFYEWILIFLSLIMLQITFFTESSGSMRGSTPESYLWCLYTAGIVLGLGIFFRKWLSG